MQRYITSRLFAAIAVIAFLLSADLSHAQVEYEATLLYREKKLLRSERSVVATLSDGQGNPAPSPAAFRDTPFLYFTYRPEGDWQFEEKDVVEGLPLIKIEQGGRVVRAAELTPASRTKTFDYVIAAFPRSEIDVYSSMQISSELEAAPRPLTFGEAFYPGYARSLAAYEAGESSAESDPFGALSSLLPFATAKDSVRVFSFFADAERLLHEVARRPVETRQNTLATLQALLTGDAIDADLLEEAQQAQARLAALRDSLDDYLSLAGPNPSQLAERLDALETALSANRTQAADRYRASRLGYFETGSYEDFKFRTFIDVLARLLLYRETALAPASSLDSIDVSVLDRMTEGRRLLDDLGWLAEFTEVTQLLSDQVRDDQTLLGRDALINLWNQREAERQPYYYLFKAFGAQAEGDVSAAVENFERALAKTTDREMLDNLQLWLIAFDLAGRSAPQEALALVNEGIRLENSGDLVAARDQFVRATRLFSTFTPAYYHLGRVTMRKDRNAFAARTYFDRALEEDPTYVAPRLSDITFHVDEGEYELALEKLDLALAQRDLWFYHYLRAQTLHQMDRNEEALEVIEQRAKPLVSLSFDQFILLGDISKAQDDRDAARDFYRDAGRLRPESAVFNQRMQALYADDDEEEE